jgi:hypothetical protein
MSIMDEQKQTAISLFEKYNDEIKKYVAVDEFNMKQIQMDLPASRHYWVGRLIFHKQEILKLKKLRKEASNKITQKMQEESPVTLNIKTIDAAIEEHPVIFKIDEQIAEQDLLVEYLQKIENNFRSLSYDIKNLIEIVKLETT